MHTLTHLTRISGNAKTGPIPVSTSSAETCPPSCPFKAKGCYAASGPLAMHWRKVTSGGNGLSWEDFCLAIAGLPRQTLWRHNQAGDLPGLGECIDASALGQLTKANQGRKGFTYTHKHATTENLEAIRSANAQGFTVNLSANNLAHADTLADTQSGPVVVVLSADLAREKVNGEWAETPEVYRERTRGISTPTGRKVIICPATYRDNVTCASCGFCQRQRSAIVGFPAHGAAKRHVSALAVAISV